MFQDFKTEIKVLFIVVVAAIIFIVGGFLFLRSTSTPSRQDVSISSQFSIGEEVVVRGKVLENVTACVVDADCYLRVEIEGNKIVVPYGYGRNIDGRYCVEGSVQEAFDVKKGSEVEISGIVISEAEISPCDSSSYYIRTLNDDTNIDISNWQTYRSDEFGFEVKYPQGYILEKENETVVLADPEDRNNLRISFEQSAKNTKEIVEELVTNELLIGGRESFVLFLGDGDSIFNIYYIPLGPGDTLIMKIRISKSGGMPPYEQTQLFNQILSTFRFIE